MFEFENEIEEDSPDGRAERFQNVFSRAFRSIDCFLNHTGPKGSGRNDGQGPNKRPASGLARLVGGGDLTVEVQLFMNCDTVTAVLRGDHHLGRSGATGVTYARGHLIQA